MEINFISFHDLTPEANYLYCSDSITDILGYTPDEVVGRPAYDYFHPDEIPSIQRVHANGVVADKVAIITYFRIRHKDGRYLECEIVFNTCYDVIVTATSLRDRSLINAKVRAATAEEVAQVKPDGSLQILGWNQRQSKMLEVINQKFTWDLSTLSPEPRVCMILNRFTRGLTIMYASSTADFLLGVDRQKVPGTPFHTYVHPKDVSEVFKELEIAKSNDSIAHCKFDFLSPMYGPIPVEGIVSCSCDGLVIVIRRFKEGSFSLAVDFARKHPEIGLTPAEHEDMDESIPDANTIKSAHAAAELGVYIWPGTLRTSKTSIDALNSKRADADTEHHSNCGNDRSSV